DPFRSGQREVPRALVRDHVGVLRGERDAARGNNETRVGALRSVADEYPHLLSGLRSRSRERSDDPRVHLEGVRLIWPDVDAELEPVVLVVRGSTSGPVSDRLEVEEL